MCGSRLSCNVQCRLSNEGNLVKRRLVVLSTALLVVAVASAPSSGAPQDDAGAQAVRQFTARYHSEAAAIADGYHRTDDCVPGMGYHDVNFSRIDTRLEPSRPEVLLYAPTPDGGRQLAGAEWLVVDRDQDLSTDDDRPTLFGRAFDGPMPGHEPGMPIHYDLHAYVWVDNPAGTFATWNATITCPGAP